MLKLGKDCQNRFTPLNREILVYQIKKKVEVMLKNTIYPIKIS